MMSLQMRRLPSSLHNRHRKSTLFCGLKSGSYFFFCSQSRLHHRSYILLRQRHVISSQLSSFSYHALQFVRNVGITHGDESRVGYYVGLMVRSSVNLDTVRASHDVFQQSIFFATEALTVLHWSRLSDVVGRKPIILSGLLGLSLSMYSFGLSTTYWGAVLRHVYTTP